MSEQSTEKNEFAFTVGIDFGTSNSGCAYAPRDTDLANDDAVKFIQTGTEHINNKIPTTIALKRQSPHAFVEFGGGTLNHFDPETHLLFHNFKMQLYNNPEADTLQPDIGDTEVETELIIARCLGHFKKCALDHFNLSLNRTVEASEVMWVVTVPAMWQEAAKVTMRQAAFIAGLISDPQNPQNFTLAYEPECAALSVINQHKDSLKDGDRYLVFDCGGGTIDVAFHKFHRNGDTISIEEEDIVQGLPNGSTRIDRAVLDKLDEIFQHKIPSLTSTSPAAFDFISNVLERAKTSWKSGQKMSLIVTAFSEEIMTEFGGSVKSVVEQYNETVQDDELKVKVTGQRVNLPPKMVEEIFHQVVRPITDLACSFLAGKENVKFLFLVGGFASSKYLRDQLQTAIENSQSSPVRILTVHHPSVSVLLGAVKYGLNREVMKLRCSHETIGVETEMDWAHSMPQEWRYYDKNSQSWKVKRFTPIVRRREQCTSKQRITREFFPKTNTDTSVVIRIFSTPLEDIPVATNEPGLCFVGEIEIPVQPGNIDENPVSVSLAVGGTQLLVYVQPPGGFERVVDFSQSEA